MRGLRHYSLIRRNLSLFLLSFLALLVVPSSEAHATCANNDEACIQQALQAAEIDYRRNLCSTISRGAVHVPPPEAHATTLPQSASHCLQFASIPVAGEREKVCMRFQGESNKMNRLRWSCTLGEDQSDCEAYNRLATKTSAEAKGFDYDEETCSLGKLASGKCRSQTFVFWGCACDSDFQPSDEVHGSEASLKEKILNIKLQVAERNLRNGLKARFRMLQSRLEDKRVCPEDKKSVWATDGCKQFFDETAAQAKMRTQCRQAERASHGRDDAGMGDPYACDSYYKSLQDSISLESRIAMNERAARGERVVGTATASDARAAALAEIQRKNAALLTTATLDPAPQTRLTAEREVRPALDAPVSPADRRVVAAPRVVARAADRSAAPAAGTGLYSELGKSVAGDIRIILASEDDRLPPHFKATRKHLVGVQVCADNRPHGCRQYVDETAAEALKRWECCGDDRECSTQLEMGSGELIAACQEYIDLFDKVSLNVRIIESKRARQRATVAAGSLDAELAEVDRLRRLAEANAQLAFAQERVRIRDRERLTAERELKLARLEEIRLHACAENSLTSACNRWADESVEEGIARVYCETKLRENPGVPKENHNACKHYQSLFDAVDIDTRIAKIERYAKTLAIELPTDRRIPEREAAPVTKQVINMPLCPLANYDRVNGRCKQFSVESEADANAREKCEKARKFNNEMGGGAEDQVRRFCDGLKWEFNYANMQIINTLDPRTLTPGAAAPAVVADRERRPAPAAEVDLAPAVVFNLAEHLLKFDHSVRRNGDRYEITGAKCVNHSGSVCIFYDFEQEQRQLAQARIQCEAAHGLGLVNTEEFCKDNKIDLKDGVSFFNIDTVEEADRELEKLKALKAAADALEMNDLSGRLGTKVAAIERARTEARDAAERIATARREAERRVAEEPPAAETAATTRLLEKMEAIIATQTEQGKVIAQLVVGLTESRAREERYVRALERIAAGDGLAEAIAAEALEGANGAVSTYAALEERLKDLAGERYCVEYAPKKDGEESRECLRFADETKAIAALRIKCKVENDSNACAEYARKFKDISLDYRIAYNKEARELDERLNINRQEMTVAEAEARIKGDREPAAPAAPQEPAGDADRVATAPATDVMDTITLQGKPCEKYTELTKELGLCMRFVGESEAEALERRKGYKFSQGENEYSYAEVNLIKRGLFDGQWNKDLEAVCTDAKLATGCKAIPVDGMGKVCSCLDASGPVVATAPVVDREEELPVTVDRPDAAPAAEASPFDIEFDKGQSVFVTGDDGIEKTLDGRTVIRADKLECAEPKDRVCPEYAHEKGVPGEAENRINCLAGNADACSARKFYIAPSSKGAFAAPAEVDNDAATGAAALVRVEPPIDAAADKDGAGDGTPQEFGLYGTKGPTKVPMAECKTPGVTHCLHYKHESEEAHVLQRTSCAIPKSERSEQEQKDCDAYPYTIVAEEPWTPASERPDTITGIGLAEDPRIVAEAEEPQREADPRLTVDPRLAPNLEAGLGAEIEATRRRLAAEKGAAAEAEVRPAAEAEVRPAAEAEVRPAAEAEEPGADIATAPAPAVAEARDPKDAPVLDAETELRGAGASDAAAGQAMDADAIARDRDPAPAETPAVAEAPKVGATDAEIHDRKVARADAPRFEKDANGKWVVPRAVCKVWGTVICREFKHERNKMEILQRIACETPVPDRSEQDEKDCAAYPYRIVSVKPREDVPTMEEIIAAGARLRAERDKGAAPAEVDAAGSIDTAAKTAPPATLTDAGARADAMSEIPEVAAAGMARIAPADAKVAEAPAGAEPKEAPASEPPRDAEIAAGVDIKPTSEPIDAVEAFRLEQERRRLAEANEGQNDPDLQSEIPGVVAAAKGVVLEAIPSARPKTADPVAAATADAAPVATADAAPPKTIIANAGDEGEAEEDADHSEELIINGKVCDSALSFSKELGFCLRYKDEDELAASDRRRSTKFRHQGRQINDRLLNNVILGLIPYDVEEAKTEACLDHELVGNCSSKKLPKFGYVCSCPDGFNAELSKAEMAAMNVEDLKQLIFERRVKSDIKPAAEVLTEAHTEGPGGIAIANGERILPESDSGILRTPAKLPPPQEVGEAPAPVAALDRPEIPKVEAGAAEFVPPAKSEPVGVEAADGEVASEAPAALVALGTETPAEATAGVNMDTDAGTTASTADPDAEKAESKGLYDGYDLDEDVVARLKLLQAEVEAAGRKFIPVAECAVEWQDGFCPRFKFGEKEETEAEAALRSQCMVSSMMGAADMDRCKTLPVIGYTVPEKNAGEALPHNRAEKGNGVPAGAAVLVPELAPGLIPDVAPLAIGVTGTEPKEAKPVERKVIDLATCPLGKRTADGKCSQFDFEDEKMAGIRLACEGDSKILPDCATLPIIRAEKDEPAPALPPIVVELEFPDLDAENADSRVVATSEGEPVAPPAEKRDTRQPLAFEDVAPNNDAAAANGGAIRTVEFKPEYRSNGTERECADSEGFMNDCARFTDETEAQADLRSVCLYGKPHSGGPDDDYEDEEARRKACRDYNIAMGNDYIVIPGEEQRFRERAVAGAAPGELAGKTSGAIMIGGRLCLKPVINAHGDSCREWADEYGPF